MSQGNTSQLRMLQPNEWIEGISVYRGDGISRSDSSISISSPTKREPVSMDPEVQREIDDWFETAFGCRFRERSLFASGDIRTAKMYARNTGEIRRLSPISEFAFCWSPKVEDLFLYHREHHSIGIPALLEQAMYQTTDLLEAVISGNEILFIGTFQATKVHITV